MGGEVGRRAEEQREARRESLLEGGRERRDDGAGQGKERAKWACEFGKTAPAWRAGGICSAL